MSAFFEAHKSTLEKALEVSKTRDYWSPYPEVASGKIYGETAKDDGAAAFKSVLGGPFKLEGHPGESTVGAEQSPYGIDLDIAYPKASPAGLLKASSDAATGWAKASIEERTGVCLEILDRLNKRSFEMANAVSQTTGQAFMMAFQAGGPHAQDRGLEAVTYAYAEMTRTPQTAVWTKPQGKHDPLVLEKRYRVVPRGTALVIGCATFPTWNSYPGLFASLATGNTVIVKPHPGAILPLAITVQIGRDVLKEAGFDPNVLLLAADEPGSEITKELVEAPQVHIIDFTGSNSFGRWVRDNAGPDTQVYTEEAGVNSIVVASTDNFRGMCSNIAFSLSLYSGQMCTAPQNIYVPDGGIETDEGHKSFDEVADGIGKAVDKLLSDPARAGGVCGAIAGDVTADRVQSSASLGAVLRPSAQIEGMESARTATPLILKVREGETEAHHEEQFGPISFVIAVSDAKEAIERAADLASTKGAITASVYATDDETLDAAADAFASAGVSLSCNLTGGIFVNQSAAFSDYHVTGANPAGNASLTDAAFVANRFRIAATRRHMAA
ncbi:phenylacetic acid degradation protein PaaN [Hoeflea prorocentri]|uniref:Phenylacetic acid degradation protein PaaN n=1 Tax=Hoeflea prorocentri TaxID=1922333 RepID=A0A9X3UHF2_9HYPH|nr:phenylacetic acid degradation protein PaaN [Hoeflea prorocentri]MCY6380696.1 phenylacetic acid degradation protein PaaN [Hoeflea prorocentri]MDA5398496.1 phenylacetic acid degradation protein PaaN [Hoeflea prorocentri]